MNGKKGMQHVEFIISFVIFVGFLVLAFYFFSPVRGDRIVESTLFYTSDEIAENVSVNINLFSITVKDVEEDLIAIPFPEQSGLNARVEDVNGNIIDSGFDNTNVHVDITGVDFLIVGFSEDFEPGSLNGGMVLTEGYTISSSEIREVYSEKRLRALQSFYEGEGGYEESKEEFNLPARGNFGFVLEIGEDKISAERNIPEGLEVFSQNDRVEVLRENGEVDFGEFRVLIW